MSSLKSTPRRIVTNFFFGLNAACKPPRRPHSNTPPASLPFPHALKGQKLLAQGIRPGYSCPHAWRPVGAKALYGDPNLRLCSSIHPFSFSCCDMLVGDAKR